MRAPSCKTLPGSKTTGLADMPSNRCPDEPAFNVVVHSPDRRSNDGAVSIELSNLRPYFRNACFALFIRARPARERAVRWPRLRLPMCPSNVPLPQMPDQHRVATRAQRRGVVRSVAARTQRDALMPPLPLCAGALRRIAACVACCSSRRAACSAEI